MGASELARSVLEGVAYSVRLLLGALEASSAVTTTRLRRAGGGARSSVWCQIRADVLGRPIDRVESSTPALSAPACSPASLRAFSVHRGGGGSHGATRAHVRTEPGFADVIRRWLRPLHRPLCAAQGLRGRAILSFRQRPRRWSGRSDFGFLGLGPVSGPRTRPRRLDSLGLSRIHSSELRLFNGLSGARAGTTLSAPCRRTRVRWNSGPAVLARILALS